jgi:hypothetical protein
LDSRYGYAHVRLTVRRRSARGTLTVISQYAHGQLAVCSRSAHSTPTISSRYADGQLTVHPRSARGTPMVSSRYAHGTHTFQYLTATDPTNGRSHVTRPTSGSGCSSKEHQAPEISGLCRTSFYLSFCTCVQQKLNRDGIPRGRSLCPDVGGSLVSPVSTDSLQSCHVSTDSLQYCVTCFH